jgi:putative ABC transport system permease protein
MIFTLGLRNLFHDGVRFIATVVGIVFSIVLVMVQLGLYQGFAQQVTSMIDRANADLWVVRSGTKSFDEASLLSGRERYRALITPGVGSIETLVVGYVEWRKPNGESVMVTLIGSDPKRSTLTPWNVVEGDATDLAMPGAVAIDRFYLDLLGVRGRGDKAHIADNMVRVVALTNGIRSFTTVPYVFTTTEHARIYVGAAPDQSTHLVVRLAAGADAADVRARLAAALPDDEVLTQADFAARSRTHWLFSTGAGAALLAGAILGVIVGTVIVAQTLYASTKDHLGEFATLRALGSSASWIHKVILWQAIISAAIGYGLASIGGFVIVHATHGTAFTIVITPELMFVLLLVTVGMCTVSALGAIAKVMRIDPATVFVR